MATIYLLYLVSFGVYIGYIYRCVNCRQETARTVELLTRLHIAATPVWGEKNGHYHAWTQVKTPFGIISVDWGIPSAMNGWQMLGDYPHCLAEYK